MTDLTPDLASLPTLSEDGQDDARFRVRDRLWAAIGDLFDRYHEEQSLSYAGLARRIGRSRAQVQRWLDAPVNMTSASAGLLSEGLDADVEVILRPRHTERGRNRVHPCEEAQGNVAFGRMTSFSLSQPMDLIIEENSTSAAPAKAHVAVFEKVYAEG